VGFCSPSSLFLVGNLSFLFSFTRGEESAPQRPCDFGLLSIGPSLRQREQVESDHPRSWPNCCQEHQRLLLSGMLLGIWR
jgi:hypothetical protein